jgi:hypothetical protein
MLSFSSTDRKSSLLDLPMGGEFFLPDPVLNSASNAVGTKSSQSIFPLQDSIKDSLRSPSEEDNPVINTAGLTNTNNGGNSAAASSVHLGGLVALAKSGRISKAQNLFDVEVIISCQHLLV